MTMQVDMCVQTPSGGDVFDRFFFRPACSHELHSRRSEDLTMYRLYVRLRKVSYRELL